MMEVEFRLEKEIADQFSAKEKIVQSLLKPYI
jgi:hypothetical protein